MALNDGALRIFLNTKGTNDHEVSRELIGFLHYIESTDRELADRSGSERIQKIHTCVSRVKQNEIAGVKYMQRWEEEWMFREEGREEGRHSALLQSIQTLMAKLNMTVEEAMDMLEKGQIKVRTDFSFEEKALVRVTSLTGYLVRALIVIAIFIGSCLLCLAFAFTEKGTAIRFVFLLLGFLGIAVSGFFSTRIYRNIKKGK